MGKKLQDLTDTERDILKPNLWDQLGNAVSRSAAEDQIVWTIFGVFAATNSVLMVALFTTGDLPKPTVGIVVCAAGAILCWIWFLIQCRAIRWLEYYEKLIRQLEETLDLPDEIAISARLNSLQRNRQQWYFEIC